VFFALTGGPAESDGSQTQPDDLEEVAV
jgi:hypothetical protein